MYRQKAAVIQIPLRMAWALTIHKSQGMSLDYMQCALDKVFAFGQAYVALSRARTLDGLQLLTFDGKGIMADPVVEEFYNRIAERQGRPARDVPGLDAPPAERVGGVPAVAAAAAAAAARQRAGSDEAGVTAAGGKRPTAATDDEEDGDDADPEDDPPPKRQ